MNIIFEKYIENLFLTSSFSSIAIHLYFPSSCGVILTITKDWFLAKSIGRDEPKFCHGYGWPSLNQEMLNIPKKYLIKKF